MILDLRARVYCNLGPLISADIADDYAQQSGLVKCRGTVELNGIYVFSPGTIVKFAYLKNGRLALIPRVLRVLSSYTDPFSRQTTVQVGCKLTYLEDLQEPKTGNFQGPKADDDPDSIDQVPLEVRDYVPAFITAGFVFQYCLDKLELTSSGASLSMKFNEETFRLSKPYVEVMSDLLVSSNLFGYIDHEEVLQVEPLNADPSTGPLYNEENIIETEPIGVGQLPGSQVLVNYKSLQLKPIEEKDEDEKARLNWEFSRSVSTGREVRIEVKDGPVFLSTYTLTEDYTQYEDIKILDSMNNVIEEKEVVKFRQRITSSYDAEYRPSVILQLINAGFSASNTFRQTIDETSYKYDKNGELVSEESRTLTPIAWSLGRVPLKLAYEGEGYVPQVDSTESKASQTVRKFYEKIGDYTRVITETYGYNFDKKIEGQLATGFITLPVNPLNTPIVSPLTRAGSYIDYLVSESSSSLLSRTVEENSGRVDAYGRPNRADRVRAEFAKTEGRKVDENNRVEETTEVNIVAGAEFVLRRIEFNIPYNSDDNAINVGGTWTIVPSGAQDEAAAYGRTQNRLLLGNRYGISVKLPPEIVPLRPMAPCYVQAAGYTGFYRINACTWTMSPDGIVCGIDLLFWAGVGQEESGTPWFPIAPGVVSLPETPAVTTNPSPEPGLSVEIPEGFDELDPDLDELFNEILPSSGEPVFPQTMSPGSAVLPYSENQVWKAQLRLTSATNLQPFGPGTYTPSPLANLAIYGNVAPEGLIFLMHFNGAAGSAEWSDDSHSRYSLSPYGTASIASGGKFGQNSFYNDGLFVNSGVATDEYAEIFYNDFTAEAWIKPNEDLDPLDQNSSGYYKIIGFGFSNEKAVFMDDSGYISWWDGDGNGPYAVPGEQAVLGEWSHVAVVRKDGIVTIYLNGVACDTPYSDSTNIEDEILVGGYSFEPFENFVGYISEVAVFNVARYVEDFTPPTRPYWGDYPMILPGPEGLIEYTGSSADLLREFTLQADSAAYTLTGSSTEFMPITLSSGSGSFVLTGASAGFLPFTLGADGATFSLSGTSADPIFTDPNFSNVSILLHMDGANNSTAFVDNSSNSITVTRAGDAKISTTQSKFGGSSGYFDGTGDQLSTTTQTAFGLGTADYTIECWLYCAFSNSNNTYFTVFQVANGSVVSQLRFGDSGFGHRLQFACGSSLSDVFGVTLTKNNFTNAWKHVAVVRSSGAITIYVDGIAATRSTSGPETGTTVTHNLGTSSILYIAYNSVSAYFNGYIDDFRITKGVARYTTNFTAPTRAHPDS